MRVTMPSRRRTRVLCALLAALVITVLTAVPAAATTTYVVALAGTLDQVLVNIRNWIIAILATVATTFLTVGGLRYLAANGDPGEVEKAKSAFRNAAIGFGLAALAPLVVDALKNIVGGL